MSSGVIKAYQTVVAGHLTVTLSDSEGNVKAVRNHNVISSYAQRKMVDAIFQGSTGIMALYVYVFSGMNGTPTLSMPTACSGYGNPSINLTNQPHTLTYSFNNDQNWSLNGTMTFVGYGGYSSIDAAALCWQPTASLSWADRSLSQWYAAAKFTDLPVCSVDLLSFNWVFSVSTTLSSVL
jgi:hypothetical protein